MIDLYYWLIDFIEGDKDRPPSRQGESDRPRSRAEYEREYRDRYRGMSDCQSDTLVLKNRLIWIDSGVN